MKKFLVWMLVAMMALAMLTGCATKPAAEGDVNAEKPATEGEAHAEEPAGEKITVAVWFSSDAMAQKEAIVEQFNAAHDDIEVVASYQSTDGLKDALKIAASSNTMPDCWRTYGGSLGGYYVDNGLTYDLTDYAKENGWWDKFSNATLDICTYGERLYGYPSSFNVISIWYRKDIFDKYSIAVPTTFEEFEAACATLKENGITPISTAGLYGWHVMRLVEQLVEYYAGAELHDKLNAFEASWNCPEVIEALTKYQEFGQKGYFPAGFLTDDPEQTNYALFSGTAAMDVDGQWFDSNLISNEQDMSLYGTFAFPGGGTNRLSAFAEMFQFDKNISAEKLDAVVSFLDYYLSDECVNQYPDGYNLPLPLIGAKAPADQVHVDEIFATSETNGTFTITDEAFPAEVADVLFNVQAALISGEMTPEEGAAAIQTAAESYLASVA